MLKTFGKETRGGELYVEKKIIENLLGKPRKRKIKKCPVYCGTPCIIICHLIILEYILLKKIYIWTLLLILNKAKNNKVRECICLRMICELIYRKGRWISHQADYCFQFSLFHVIIGQRCFLHPYIIGVAVLHCGAPES